MKQFRFSLLGLVAATTLVAVACGAIVYASPAIASLLWSATLLVLTAGLLAALLAAGNRRTRAAIAC